MHLVMMNLLNPSQANPVAGRWPCTCGPRVRSNRAGRARSLSVTINTDPRTNQWPGSRSEVTMQCVDFHE